MSKIFGVPLVLITLVLFIIIPIIAVDIVILRAIDRVEQKLEAPKTLKVDVVPSPTASPSAVPSISPTKAVRQVVPVRSTTPGGVR